MFFSSTSQKLYPGALCPPTFRLSCFASCGFSLRWVCASERAGWDFERRAGLDLAPSNEAPVLLDTAAQGHLLAFASADGRGELELGEIVLHGHHTGAGRHGSNVKHQDLALGELGDLPCLLCTLRSHTQQPSEKEEVDLQSNVVQGNVINIYLCFWLKLDSLRIKI